jgi:hypothetical protein
MVEISRILLARNIWVWRDSYRFTLPPNFSFHPGTGACRFAIVVPILSCNFHPAGNRVAEAWRWYSPDSGFFTRILKSSIASLAATSIGFEHSGPTKKLSLTI